MAPLFLQLVGHIGNLWRHSKSIAVFEVESIGFQQNTATSLTNGLTHQNSQILIRNHNTSTLGPTQDYSYGISLLYLYVSMCFHTFHWIPTSPLKRSAAPPSQRLNQVPQRFFLPLPKSWSSNTNQKRRGQSNRDRKARSE